MNARPAPLWIREAEVVELLSLPQAVAALEAGLRLEAQGAAQNMGKTHVTWGGGDTLHAIGATFEGAGVVGTKTWAHTHGGATPLLLVWDAATGGLRAIVEAFALGQLRTGAVSGVAARWMARRDASVMALYGTGKQALAQLAAVAAVRPLTEVRVWGRDPSRRESLAEAADALGYSCRVRATASAEAAADGADIITLATRARTPFFDAAWARPGAHINAIGAITPEREEFAPGLLERATLVAADDPQAARRLSAEFRRFYGDDEGAWAGVRPLSGIVALGAGRPASADITVFKAMGMGISDLALGVELLRQAERHGLGEAFHQPVRARPRLGASGVQGV